MAGQRGAFQNGTAVYDTKMSTVLKGKISFEFTRYVKVDNVLPVFKRRMDRDKVLTEQDVARIKAENSNKGELQGADFLLERLSLYLPNWFTVLQGVLRDPEVKLEFLADIFDRNYNDACTQILGGTVAIHRPDGYHRADSTTVLSPQSPNLPFNITNNLSQRRQQTCKSSDNCLGSDNSNFLERKRKKKAKKKNKNKTTQNELSNQGPQNDFDLDEDNVISEPEDGDAVSSYTALSSPEMSAMPSDMPKPKASSDSSQKSSVQSRPLPNPPEDTAGEAYEQTLVKTFQESSLMPNPTPVKKKDRGNDSCSVSSSRDEYENISSKGSEYESVGEPCGATAASASYSSSSQEYQNELQVGKAQSGSRSRVSIQSSDDKKRLVSNFSFAETEQALCKFKGWHKEQTDKNVIHTFSQILEEKKDGHYLLWFWEKKKRPAICVRGKLVTYVIHRRREKSELANSKYIYYVDKSLTKNTLDGLFEHHLEHGLPNLKEGNNSALPIRLVYPIFP